MLPQLLHHDWDEPYDAVGRTFSPKQSSDFIQHDGTYPMFEVLSQKEILAHLTERANLIKKTDKLPSLSDAYISFLTRFDGAEISADIELYSYEEALNTNRHIERDYSTVSQSLWVIGRSGAGDEWFIRKEEDEVLFYDHDQGEYDEENEFVQLGVGFLEFLQMAFLMQQMEDALNEGAQVSESDRQGFISAVNSIRPGLFDLYPYSF